MNMPSVSQPAPGAFARAISAEIRSDMARHRVSGKELARMIGRSQSYLAKRLRDEVSMTANDVEEICRALDEDIVDLVLAAARVVRGS